MEQASKWKQLWLSYEKKAENGNASYFQNVWIQGFSVEEPVVKSALKELTDGALGMLGAKVQPAGEGENAAKSSGIVLQRLEENNEAGVKAEGYVLKEEDGRLTVGATDENGLLYGVFHLLRLISMEKSLAGVFKTCNPDNPLRMFNHWDNMDGSIERGYSGRSFFFADDDVIINERTRDYARLMASIGINGTVINNVNVKQAASWLITDRFFEKVAQMAEIFAEYGIKFFLSLNYASTIEIGGLDSADPLDERVIAWWKEKMKECFTKIPNLGGFLVKADSEGRPGPFTYGRTQADGANMLADAHGIGEFLGEMAEKAFRPYEAFTVGEVFNVKDDELKDFIGDDGYFSSMFDFNGHIFGKSYDGWYASKRYLTPDEYKQCIFETQKKIGDMGMVSNIIENHDEPRGVCYYIQPEDRCTDAKKLLAGVYFMLRGLPFIYQGQEIGMENLDFHSIDEIDDISTLDEYKVAREAGLSDEEALSVASAFSRDNARTPVQWYDGENAGFTTGKPWLEVNPNYKQINVQAQENDEDSVLAFYKKLTRLRKSEEYKETIVYGQLIPYLEEEKNLIAYFRKGEKTLLVLANFQKDPRKVQLPAPAKKVVLNNKETVNWGCPRDTSEQEACRKDTRGMEIELSGFQYVMLELEN